MIDKLSNMQKAILACSIAAIFYCYEYYLRVAPSVISEDLMQSFDISHASLGLLSAFFYYAYMPVQIPVGLMLDKYGPRKVLTFACAMCALGTFIFSITKFVWVAQLGRLFLGFGSAFAFVGFLKLASNWLAHKYYAFMVGICTLLGMFGAMAGEVILAQLNLYMPWQNALSLSAVVGIILAGAIWILVRDRPHRNKRKKHIVEPVVSDRKLLQGLKMDITNPQIWLVGIIGCLTFLPLSSFAELWAVPYLVEIGYAKTDAATASAMVFLGFGVGSPCWGAISNKLRSRRKPLIIGALFSAVFGRDFRLWVAYFHLFGNPTASDVRLLFLHDDFHIDEWLIHFH